MSEKIARSLASALEEYEQRVVSTQPDPNIKALMRTSFLAGASAATAVSTRQVVDTMRSFGAAMSNLSIREELAEIVKKYQGEFQRIGGQKQ